MTTSLAGPAVHSIGGTVLHPRAYELLGVRVYPLTVSELHELIASAVDNQGRVVITSQNLHGVYLYHRSEKMRALHERSLPRIDGMSLVMMGRLLGHRMAPEHRVTWVDWIGPLMDEAVRRGWRIFYLGSKPDVVERGARVLKHRHAGLQLAVRHGYFDTTPGSAENADVLDSIARFQPHILMVGMGMPRQESWIYDNLDYLDVNAILTCGAAMDYVAGVIRTPPRWMGRVGLEWLYRLLSEPRRLGVRYLVEPWFLAPLLIRDLMRRKS